MIIAGILRQKNAPVICVEADTSVRQAISILNEARIGAVLVLEGDRLAGLFSERDLVRLIVQAGEEVLEAAVGDVMTTDLVTLTPEQSCADAMALMTNERIRHLPVLEDGRLVGIVSIGDLVKHRIEEIESEAEQLKAYITAA